MATPLHILIVDDSPQDADRILRALRRGGYQPMWKRVDTPGTLTAALTERARAWDAVTCDDAMPQLRYLSALHIVRALKPGIPFILVSNGGDDADATDVVQRNACGIVRKNRLDDLPAVIARAVRAAPRA